MKLSFDSALLWLLPFLYLLSILYYWGFWGTFDIDAYNYYPTSDFIKGATAPVVITFLIIGIVSIIFGIAMSVQAFLAEKVNFLAEKIKRTTQLSVLLLLISLAAVAVIYMGREIFFPSDPFHRLQMILTSIGTFIAIFINNILIRKDKLQDELSESSEYMKVVRFSRTMFLCLMPFQAYIDGYQNAKYIEQGKQYQYIVADSLAVPEKAVYKYLGKAGDYQILVSEDNTKKIIVPASKLTPLIIERFSQGEPASEARLKAYRKRLAALAPKQIE